MPKLVIWRAQTVRRPCHQVEEMPILMAELIGLQAAWKQGRGQETPCMELRVEAPPQPLKALLI